MTRTSVLLVVALLIAGACIWYAARLLAASANPLWFAVPGIGLALAYVLAQRGLELRERDRR